MATATYNNHHYIQSITDLGNIRPIVTNQAIYTDTKIKLLDKGSTIDGGLFERLVQHKLMPRFDEAFSIDDAINHANIQAKARELLNNDPGFALLKSCHHETTRMLKALAGIKLIEAMAFKLTVASCQRPEVFDHSLRVALIALHLAIRCRILSESKLEMIATAALFHDIGILHVSPKLLAPGHQLESEERHHLYAHPVTGYLLLSEYPEYHPAIARAVLEHHERLDGSGYPRGIQGKEISKKAQILMLAEIANTVFEHTPDTRNHQRLSVLLRLNHTKFNRQMSSILLNTIQSLEEASQVNATTPLKSETHLSIKKVATKLAELKDIFSSWESLTTTHPPILEQNPVIQLVSERINTLKRNLSDAGVEFECMSALLDSLAEDPVAIEELDLLLGETRWQLVEILHEGQRRYSAGEQKSLRPPQALTDWLAHVTEILHAF